MAQSTAAAFVTENAFVAMRLEMTQREHKADTRHRLIYAENAMLEDGLTPAQIRDHMRRHADAIDAQINQPEGDGE